MAMNNNVLRDYCGVIGIFAPGLDVARLAFYGLYALQHRGQESAGIAVADGKDVVLHKEMGLVPDVFNDQVISTLKGSLAIGHVRYSTTGASHPINAQPLVFDYQRGRIGLAHNGNLTNTDELRKQLGASGAVFQTTTDSEVIMNLIARSGGHTIEESMATAMRDIQGAFSLVVITEKQIIAARDPYGFRPLCYGEIEGQGYVVASESCALDIVGARFIRDIRPGEILVLDEKGATSIAPETGRKYAHCVFEQIYLARADSVIDGFNVNRIRRKMGEQLAKEHQIQADLVLPIPDSGIPAARGYADGSGIPLEEGLMKNRYVGRTFIQPSQHLRELGVHLKLNPIRDLLEGKSLVLVDDSLVRGTTSSQIVRMLKESGVREVHLCVSSPPIIHPCYYGIDISNNKELIAAAKSIEEIKEHIGADSLYYLSLEGLLSVFGEYGTNFCTACFNGKYPTIINATTMETSKEALLQCLKADSANC